MTTVEMFMHETPPSPGGDSATLRGAWSRLRRRTHSRVKPRLLIVFFYAWPLLLDSLHVEGSTSAWAVLPGLAVGFWFYGIVFARLAAAAPFGRSPLQSASNLWLLFMGYTVWLGFFPPTESKWSWTEWAAWLLVIAGLVAILVARPGLVEPS